eukprot:Rmarinus@m.20069
MLSLLVSSWKADASCIESVSFVVFLVFSALMSTVSGQNAMCVDIYVHADTYPSETAFNVLESPIDRPYYNPDITFSTDGETWYSDDLYLYPGDFEFLLTDSLSDGGPDGFVDDMFGNNLLSFSGNWGGQTSVLFTIAGPLRLHIELQVDDFPSEASFNIQGPDGTDYFSSSHGFSTQQEILSYDIGAMFWGTWDVRLEDTYGDAGLTGFVDDIDGTRLVTFGTYTDVGHNTLNLGTRKVRLLVHTSSGGDSGSTGSLEIKFFLQGGGESDSFAMTGMSLADTDYIFDLDFTTYGVDSGTFDGFLIWAPSGQSDNFNIQSLHVQVAERVTGLSHLYCYNVDTLFNGLGSLGTYEVSEMLFTPDGAMCTREEGDCEGPALKVTFNVVDPTNDPLLATVITTEGSLSVELRMDYTATGTVDAYIWSQEMPHGDFTGFAIEATGSDIFNYNGLSVAELDFDLTVIATHTLETSSRYLESPLSASSHPRALGWHYDLIPNVCGAGTDTSGETVCNDECASDPCGTLALSCTDTPFGYACYCAANSYDDDTACVACPSGKISAEGSIDASECTCDVGMTGSNCDLCPVNTYKDWTGSGDCDSCPPGTTSPTGSDDLNDCACSAGYLLSYAAYGCEPEIEIVIKTDTQTQAGSVNGLAIQFLRTDGPLSDIVYTDSMPSPDTIYTTSTTSDLVGVDAANFAGFMVWLDGYDTIFINQVDLTLTDPSDSSTHTYTYTSVNYKIDYVIDGTNAGQDDLVIFYPDLTKCAVYRWMGNCPGDQASIAVGTKNKWSQVAAEPWPMLTFVFKDGEYTTNLRNDIEIADQYHYGAWYYAEEYYWDAANLVGVRISFDGPDALAFAGLQLDIYDNLGNVVSSHALETTDFYLENDYNEYQPRAMEYFWELDGSVCVDPSSDSGLLTCANECLDGTTANDCGDCYDTVAGHECQTCAEGYSGSQPSCADIDECATNTHDCTSSSDCTNTAGSFTCAVSCPTDTYGDGTTCTDCHADANSPAGSTVSTDCGCNLGFTGDGHTTCTDVEECSTGVDDCDANAYCANTAGSFACDCHAGYWGDGVSCASCHAEASSPVGSTANTDCVCNAGYGGDGHSSCTDVDECAADTDNCHTNAACTNTVGS